MNDLALPVNVVRHDVRRFRVAKAFAPLGPGLGVVARRMGNLTLSLALLAFALTIVGVFISSRSSRGRKPLTVRPHQISLDDIAIARQDVTRWTWSGFRARLYGEKYSWALTAVGAPDALREALARVFGPPATLVRRGSPKARAWAAGAAIAGLLTLPLVILFGQPALLPVSLLPLLVGFATYMALSQRIVRV